MQIVRQEVYSCEPLPLTLHSERALTDDQLDTLEAGIAEWLAERERDCPGAFEKYAPRLELQRHANRLKIRIHAYWLPEDWIPSLADRLEAVLSILQQLDIGEDFEPPRRTGTALIRVPSKTVGLDDGTQVIVMPFDIARYPVSIEEFQTFVNATGYRTLAERRRDEFIFRNIPAHAGIPFAKRATLAAEYVSHADAVSYCEWASARLPTEPEWIAAALLDEKVYADTSARQKRYDELCNDPRALQQNGMEMTSTIVEGDVVVTRYGPYLIRNLVSLGVRCPVPRHYYGDLRFRVCAKNTS